MAIKLKFVQLMMRVNKFVPSIYSHDMMMYFFSNKRLRPFKVFEEYCPHNLCLNAQSNRIDCECDEFGLIGYLHSLPTWILCGLRQDRQIVHCSGGFSMAHHNSDRWTHAFIWESRMNARTNCCRSIWMGAFSDANTRLHNSYYFSFFEILYLFMVWRMFTPWLLLRL